MVTAPGLWPDRHDLISVKLSEAKRAADQLGHVLLAWTSEGLDWTAACVHCKAEAGVKWRGLGPVITGMATAQRCGWQGLPAGHNGEGETVTKRPSKRTDAKPPPVPAELERLLARVARGRVVAVYTVDEDAPAPKPGKGKAR